MAEPEGYITIFVEAGEPIATILTTLLRQKKIDVVERQEAETYFREELDAIGKTSVIEEADVICKYSSCRFYNFYQKGRGFFSG